MKYNLPYDSCSTSLPFRLDGFVITCLSSRLLVQYSTMMILSKLGSDFLFTAYRRSTPNFYSVATNRAHLGCVALSDNSVFLFSFFLLRSCSFRLFLFLLLSIIVHPIKTTLPKASRAFGTLLASRNGTS
jgi:hypothetical protein